MEQVLVVNVQSSLDQAINDVQREKLGRHVRKQRVWLKLVVGGNRLLKTGCRRRSKKKGMGRQKGLSST